MSAGGPVVNFQLPTRVVFGPGALRHLGSLARELGFRRPLLVADRGLVAVGHVDRVTRLLEEAGIGPVPFHDFDVNPTTAMVAAGRDFAAPLGIDSILGLGGGSSMDCAKGINFLLTNGGVMADYRGYGKASRPLLPMLAVPTTAGTGSEAQSYAVISDAATHAKMACGDPTAAFRAAILDPEVTLSQPAFVTATSGFDALAHAVETAVTSRRSAFSACFSREAWRLLSANYARVLTHPDDIEARGAMQLGAFHAGLAIEQSMLGAGHACANPLTASYDITHGVALALVLPQVVDWNAETCAPLYAELARTLAQAAPNGNAGERVADWLRTAAQTAGLPTRLRTEGVIETDLPRLADDAAQQWTGTFNPRPFTAAAALEIYRSTY